MKVSRYIECLQSLQQRFGDLEVETLGVYERMTANGPSLAFGKKPTTRERKSKFWSATFDKVWGEDEP